MDRSAWLSLLAQSLESIGAWEARWPDTSIASPTDAAREALEELCERLSSENYPFFHPLYAGQMLKPPHPIAWTAYATAMAINPNNHALDGGPATAHLEREAVADIARMFGFDEHLGHLSASGTIANLEALWVAREPRGPHTIAVCENAHYTHARMASLLGLGVETIRQTPQGTMDVDSLADLLSTKSIGTIVVTMGTTALGAIDPLHQILPLARAAGCRVHADAAYGGFFTLLAQRGTPLVEAPPFAALAKVDSVVVDPHKQGLQPYGCGCVVYADPAVGAVYKHDSPYTYFTSDELHLGEISLECSRSGASAAALWTTLRALPLAPNAGLGEVLAGGRRAALEWARLIDGEPSLRLLTPPETDIVCFAPEAASVSRVNQAVARIFQTGMREGEGAFFLAKLRVDKEQGSALWSDLTWDVDELVVLRSVLMKPEHESWVARLHGRVVAAANGESS